MDNLLKNAILLPFNLLYKINPEFELRLMFRMRQGYWMDMNHPKTYNEKLQWIKLHDRNSLMPACCDKYAVREYVQQAGCGEILNKLIWEGSDPEQIPFDELPNKFVIKVTHGSTFNIICTDKATLDRRAAIRRLKKWLKAKYITCYGEWFYGIVPPRVIVEAYLEGENGMSLRDYKVCCFHGEPRYIMVYSDRNTDLKTDVFTTEWQQIPNTNMGYHCSDYKIEKPACLDEMLDAARKLSGPFYHARIDFYISHGKLYFGEVSFTNGAGFDRFEPPEFDLEIGKYMHLPVDEEEKA